MTPEEKVLAEIKEKINELWSKIAELKVTEQERRDWIKEKAEYQGKIDDYKRHKKAFEERVKLWNSQHQ